MLKIRFVTLILTLSFLTVGLTNAQVVTTDPAFPTLSGPVTITFDATQGNQGLEGYAGDVFAHTGVVTDLTIGNNGWTFVQGQWGTSNAPKLTSLGNDKYELVINDIRSFYQVPAERDILKIAILFRNEAGDKAGRAEGGADIYIDIFKEGLQASIESPKDNQVFEIGENISFSGSSSENAALTLFLDGNQYQTSQGTDISASLNATTSGNHQLVMVTTTATDTIRDTSNFVIAPSLVSETLPAGNKLGINYTSETSITLALYAPMKRTVCVIGDFNDWRADVNYFLKRNGTSDTLWTTITGLQPKTKYAFQYLIDGELRIADPLSELVLDPWNDSWIDSITYPNPHPYPASKTTGVATLIETAQEEYVWEVPDFDAPEEKDLIVYELLVRDFVAAHNYLTVIDSLDYLESLGINAIELMPVNEFEGNNSWGYNPSFHMALDKYYGTPEHFKRFIDECHKRGIAIILDVVYNHAFSQSPLCQMYWDAANFRPAGNSPFANVTAKHDFNVGYDLNHESTPIKNYVKQVVQYWLSEYNVDGFRFDLSKGFTQKNTLGDVGAWGQYDGTRVNNIRRIYSEVKEINPDAYVILEHFAENREEKELADYGCMFWGNMNHEGLEAAMGYSSNFTGGYHGSRNWNEPKLLAYTESHDEERTMVKTLQFGNSDGDYDTKDFNTSLDRSEMTYTVFYSIPGPKMMWQFQELGYDYSINENGRTGEKPIKWEYFQESPRKDLYEVISEVNKLKSTYSAFDGDSFTMDLDDYVKYVNLRAKDQSFIVVGNFDVKSREVTIPFNDKTMWYEYFTGDSLFAAVDDMIMNLEPGEYGIWTNKRMQTDLSIGSVNEINQELKIYPNPASSEVVIDLKGQSIDEYSVLDAQGREVLNGRGEVFTVTDLVEGVYFLNVSSGNRVYTSRFVKVAR